MANNYIFLMHAPTRQAVLIGKRMAIGWYTPEDVEQRLTALYDAVEYDTQDEFCLAMEDAPPGSVADTDWDYGERDGHIIMLPPREVRLRSN